MKKVAILGFGREGQSVLKFLKNSPEWKNSSITILDKNPALKPPRGIKIFKGPEYLKHLPDFDIVFRSPGIPFSLPAITSAKRKGVEFSSATKLFFDELNSSRAASIMHHAPIVVGVTGTKGKGTVCALLYDILKADGRKVVLAGNMGAPMLDEINKIKRADFVILELSSFQLQDLKVSPPIAVVLNITPDHLDAHKNFDEYVDAKKAITKYQKRTDHVFYFGDNEKSEHIAFQSNGAKHIVDPAAWKLFDPAHLKIPGAHMFANAVIAATVAQHLGCHDGSIIKAVKAFKGTPYRLQLSRELALRPNISIQFYNDSAGTNPETAAAAVQAFKLPTVLIAGGKDKGLSYDALREALRASQVTKVILYGENQEKIAAELDESELSHKFPARLYNTAVTPPAHLWNHIAKTLDETVLVNIAQNQPLCMESGFR